MKAPGGGLVSWHVNPGSVGGCFRLLDTGSSWRLSRPASASDQQSSNSPLTASEAELAYRAVTKVQAATPANAADGSHIVSVDNDNIIIMMYVCLFVRLCSVHATRTRGGSLCATLDPRCYLPHKRPASPLGWPFR